MVVVDEDVRVEVPRRWRLLLLVLLLTVLLEDLRDEDEEDAADVGLDEDTAEEVLYEVMAEADETEEGAAVVIFATPVAATGDPVMDVVVMTTLGLWRDICDMIEEMADAVSWIVTGQVVQTLLLALLMAAASAIAARMGRVKSSKRMMYMFKD